MDIIAARVLYGVPRRPLIVVINGKYYIHWVLDHSKNEAAEEPTLDNANEQKDDNDYSAAWVKTNDILDALTIWTHLIHRFYGGKMDNGTDLRERWIKLFQ